MICLASYLSLMLAGCGGSDTKPEEPQPQSPAAPAAPPPRGSLIDSPPALTSTVSLEDILADLAEEPKGQQVLQIAGAPLCRLQVHRMRYNTVDAKDTPTTASAALILPAGLAEECRGPRPIVLYAHGTSSDRNFSMTNLREDAEGIVLAAAFAAHGYIVVAPNYVGYDTSTLTYHPYLNADQSAKDMIDALAAARSALPLASAAGTTANNKLFITGYSQGGHVAMATHRAMQAAGMTVTASAPMSGPYAMAAFGDAVFQGNVNLSAPTFATFLITSYQRAYGNLYSAPTDVFEVRYAAGMDALLPNTIARSTLYAEGKLPRDALFSNIPPSVEFASITPPATPAERAPLFALGFGPDNLINNAFRLAYLRDAQTNPDGGWPTTTTGVPAAAPAHPLRQAFKQNDLRTWTPTSPVLLCGGNADPTVFYSNTQLMQGYWATRPTAPPVTVLDVDSAVASGDPYGNLKSGFATAKQLVVTAAIAGGASDGGRRALAEDYHAGLVSPFCLLATRSFFDRL